MITFHFVPCTSFVLSLLIRLHKVHIGILSHLFYYIQSIAFEAVVDLSSIPPHATAECFFFFPIAQVHPPRSATCVRCKNIGYKLRKKSFSQSCQYFVTYLLRWPQFRHFLRKPWWSSYLKHTSRNFDKILSYDYKKKYFLIYFRYFF